jgi:tetratricopeptide (TPR) repeat protein
VRVDSRAVGLAAFAVVAALVLGFAAGALPGVAAAFAGLVPTALWQLTLDRRTRRAAALTRRESALKTFAPTSLDDAYTEQGDKSPTPHGAAWYLRPEAQVVTFLPRPELNELLRWCIAGGRLEVRLVTGPGGAGKTRLAVQLSKDLAVEGWRAMWVPRGAEATAIGAVRDVGEPAVLVVDYAETRPELTRLLEGAADASDSPYMRILLLARSAGEWWQQLLDGTDYRLSQVLQTAAPIMLGPIATAGGPDEVFSRAMAAFAHRLESDCPDARLTLIDRDAVVLVVHAAALLAVLDHISIEGATELPETATEVLSGLLRHEARYWHRSAHARKIVLDSSVERLAVTLGSLIGADREFDAIKLLSRIPDLADSLERRGQVARWLHDLYPGNEIPSGSEGEGEEWIGSLRPDRVAEQLVIGELFSHRDLMAGLLADLSEQRKLRALTILARAGSADPRALALLRDALDADLACLIIPALTVTVETNPAIADLVNAALLAQPTTDDILQGIVAALPYPTFALAETAVIVFQRLVNLATSDDVKRAEYLVKLSDRLPDLGHWEEALATGDEAVNLYRALARRHRYQALTHGRRAAKLKDPDETSPVGREIVDSYEGIDPTHPGGVLPQLATSLNNQSLRLAELNRLGEALAAGEEAVSIYRVLNDNYSGMFLPDLASSLNNESLRLASLGRRGEALASMNEAVSIYRQLNIDQAGRFMSDLASSLNNQSNRLASLGQGGEALVAMEEAVAIRQNLANLQPDVFLPELASALKNQSIRYADLRRSEDSLTAINKAVAIWRELTRARRDAFLPDLAASLTNQSVDLMELDHSEEALASIQEAVSIYRGLAKVRPTVFAEPLARSLDNLTAILSALGRGIEARAAGQEAAQVRNEKI